MVHCFAFASATLLFCYSATAQVLSLEVFTLLHCCSATFYFLFLGCCLSLIFFVGIIFIAFKNINNIVEGGKEQFY